LIRGQQPASVSGVEQVTAFVMISEVANNTACAKIDDELVAAHRVSDAALTILVLRKTLTQVEG